MSATEQDACRVCGGESAFVFRQELLGREVSYFDCPECGYFQTESPDWLEEAYTSAINDFDTGILKRNQLNVGRVVMTLCAFRCLQGEVIDHAGGYGILVRLLRDVGVNARWRDKYCENLLAQGFEARVPSADCLTAFEVFEHLEHPLSELESLLEQSPVVLISTDLVQRDSTPAPDWWYLGAEHGQHIGFFRAKTLAWMARKLGCHHATDRASLHIFSRAPVPKLWRPLLRLHRFSGLVAKFTLRSRSVSDFENLRQRRLRAPQQ